MGRLNFGDESAPAYIVELEPGVERAVIAHLPTNTLEQFYIKNKQMYRKDAELDYLHDYANADFGEELEVVDMKNVVDYSIKTFPQFGTYAAITLEQEGQRNSIIKLQF